MAPQEKNDSGISHFTFTQTHVMLSFTSWDEYVYAVVPSNILTEMGTFWDRNSFF